MQSSEWGDNETPPRIDPAGGNKLQSSSQSLSPISRRYRQGSETNLSRRPRQGAKKKTQTNRKSPQKYLRGANLRNDASHDLRSAPPGGGGGLPEQTPRGRDGGGLSLSAIENTCHRRKSLRKTTQREMDLFQHFSDTRAMLILRASHTFPHLARLIEV